MGVPLPIPTSAFKDHIAKLQDYNAKEVELFWKTKFKDIGVAQFPLLGVADKSKPINGKISKHLKFPNGNAEDLQKRTGFTMNTLVRVAWAMVLKYYIRKESFAFGAVTSGRDSGIPGIERFPLKLTIAVSLR